MKKLIMIFILCVFVLGVYGCTSENLSGEAVGALEKNKEKKSVGWIPGCEDTDGGLAYYFHGAIFINGSNVASDSCDGNYLTELYCDDPYSDIFNFTIKYCKYGCKDRACVEEEVYFGCNDTDGGKDYYTKGRIIGTMHPAAYPVYYDTCLDGPNGKNSVVRELFCNEDDLGEPTIYECPSLVCADGVCID